MEILKEILTKLGHNIWKMISTNISNEFNNLNDVYQLLIILGIGLFLTFFVTFIAYKINMKFFVKKKIIKQTPSPQQPPKRYKKPQTIQDIDGFKKIT